jgi:asparagine synthase (glutamine-hydrolysing)
MCGICGTLSLTGAGIDPELLPGMLGMLRHRGPDDTRIHADGGVGLGHTRLSIVDISGGAQPMPNPDRSLWITFNGEIFNYVELRDELIRKGHKFATASDTEVILHLYEEEGETCVSRLNGQWAFAIWDVRRRKLFLSRDRLGVRPLFYAQTAGKFFFASEIKALLACPDIGRELDFHALDQIFTFWTALPPRTAFKSVKQLPPGHSLTIENGRVRISRYWHIDFAPPADLAPDGDQRAGDELLALILDATRIRLRADVPVGAYLSGGLDSTLIAALAKRLAGEKLTTFAVRFEDAAFDESSYQREAVSFLETGHSSVLCSYGDIAAVFPEVVWHAEQPILRTAPAPLFLLSKLVRDSGFKVILTGEGADELFGGYDIFKEAKIRRFCASHPESRWRPLLLKRLYPYSESIQRQPAAYLRNFFQATSTDLESSFFSHLPRWELTRKLKLFLSESARREMSSNTAVSELEQALPPQFTSWAPFNQAEYLETMYLLPGYILSSQGDRMAMAHSVEARHPFLDYRVVEFAAKLPPRLKMKVLDQKHLLKSAARGLVPECIRKRPKQPYRAPDGRSFFDSATDYVEELLSPATITRDRVFDPQSVNALAAKFKSGRPTTARDDMALVGILSTQLLLERFTNGRVRPTEAGAISRI